LLAIIALSLLSFSCGLGNGEQDKTGEPGSTGSIAYNLSWPEGFSFNRETLQITGHPGSHMNYLPSYMTGIHVTVINSSNVVVIDQDLPLDDNLVIPFTLEPGTYTFYILVTTDVEGQTFTDQKTVTLSAGANINLVFDLQINIAPIVDVFESALTSQFARSSGGDAGIEGSAEKNYEKTITCYKGQKVNFTVKTHDPDNDDITGKVSGGDHGEITDTQKTVSGGTTTITASWTASLNDGVSLVTITLDDNHGGVAVITWTVNITNRPPAATATASPNPASPDELVTFTCRGDDADRHDTVSVKWSGVASGSGHDQVVDTRSFSEPGTYEATCTATDSDPVDGRGVSTTATVSLVVKNATCSCDTAASFTIIANPGGWPDCDAASGCHSIVQFILGEDPYTYQLQDGQIITWPGGCTQQVNCSSGVTPLKLLDWMGQGEY